MGELDKLLAKYEQGAKPAPAAPSAGSAVDELLAKYEQPKDAWDQGEGEFGILTPAWSADADLLAKRLGKKPAEVRKMAQSRNYQPGMFTQADKYLREGSVGGDILGSVPGRVAMGALDNVTGLAQTVQNAPAYALGPLAAAKLPGMLSGTQEADTDLLNTVMALKGQYRDENISDNLKLPIIGDVPTAIGNSLFPLPIGKAKAAGSGAMRLLQLAKKGASRGGLGGFIGGLMAPDESGSTENFWGNKALQTGISTAAGGLLGAGTEVGATLGGRKVVRPEPVGDVRPNVFAKDIEGSLASKRDMETNELLRIIETGSPADAKAASAALEALTNSVSHPGATVQASASIQMLRERMAKDAPFQALTAEAGKRGATAPLPRGVAAIDEQIAKIADDLSIDPADPRIKGLQSLRDRLANAGPAKVSTIRNTLASLKTEVARIYDTDRTGAAGSAEAQMVVDAIKDDLMEGLKKGGHEDLALLLGEANRGHKAYKDKWGRDASKQITQVMESQTPDTLLRQLYATDSTDAAKNLTAGLSDSGKEALKLLAIRDLVEKAQDTKGRTSKTDVRAMLSEVEKRKEVFGVLFDGMDKQRLDGLEKILDASMRRASRTGGLVAGAASGAGLGSLAGVGTVPGAVVGGMAGLKMGGTKTARGIAITDPAASFFYDLLSTPSGQRKLLEASKYKPNSPQLEAFLVKLGRAAGSGQRTPAPKAAPNLYEDETE